MLKLSHILPPTSARSTSSGKTSGRIEPNETSSLCPSAIIGTVVPASAPLHLAIAHQLEEYRYTAYRRHREAGVDDLTFPEPVVSVPQTGESERSTLIIASQRSKWHESLLDENDCWLRDCGAVPEVAGALRRIEIKYCSDPKDAIILLSLLHSTPAYKPSPTGTKDANFINGGLPDLVIAWDLFGLFADHNTNKRSGSAESLGEGDKTQAGAANKIDSAQVRSVTAQDYLSLLSMLRQTVEQLAPGAEGPKATLIVLEPHMDSTTGLPITQPQIPQSVAVGGDRKSPKYLKMAEGLQWVLSPGYRDKTARQTILEISKMEQSDEHEEQPQSSDTQRFRIMGLSGDVIAFFERRREEHTPGKPWLDRAVSVYTWREAEVQTSEDDR